MQRRSLTYYDILGVSPRAHDADIRQAYHTLAQHLHPDRNPGEGANAELFKYVSMAYVNLKTQPQRDAYNRHLLSLIAARKGYKYQYPQWQRTAWRKSVAFAGALCHVVWPFQFKEMSHG